jgi:thymidine kinase
MKTLFTGPMFSGKSSALLKLAKESGHRVLFVKPSLDNRFSTWVVETHDGEKIGAVPIESFIALAGMDCGDALAIDEISLFKPEDIARVLPVLLPKLKWFAASGIDLWADGTKNEAVEVVRKFVDETITLQGKCQCGSPSTHTTRKGPGGPQLQIGGDDLYEAVCRECWEERKST